MVYGLNIILVKYKFKFDMVVMLYSSALAMRIAAWYYMLGRYVSTITGSFSKWPCVLRNLNLYISNDQRDKIVQVYDYNII